MFKSGEVGSGGGDDVEFHMDGRSLRPLVPSPNPGLCSNPGKSVAAVETTSSSTWMGEAFALWCVVVLVLGACVFFSPLFWLPTFSWCLKLMRQYYPTWSLIRPDCRNPDPLSLTSVQ